MFTCLQDRSCFKFVSHYTVIQQDHISVNANLDSHALSIKNCKFVLAVFVFSCKTEARRAQDHRNEKYIQCCFCWSSFLENISLISESAPWTIPCMFMCTWGMRGKKTEKQRREHGDEWKGWCQQRGNQRETETKRKMNKKKQRETSNRLFTSVG